MHVANNADSLGARIVLLATLLDEGYRQAEFGGEVAPFFGKTQVCRHDDRVVHVLTALLEVVAQNVECGEGITGD